MGKQHLHTKQEHKCGHCGKVYNRVHILQKHLLTHCVKKKLTQRTKRRTTLKRHTEQDQILCEHCGFTFYSQAAFEKHMLLVPELPTNTLAPSLPTSTLVPSLPTNTLVPSLPTSTHVPSLPTTAVLHSLLTGPVCSNVLKQYECEMSVEAQEQKGKMLKEVSTVTPDVSLFLMKHWESQGYSQVPCPYCGKLFTTWDLLRKHQKSHCLPLSIYQCEVCKCTNNFRHFYELQMHKLHTHTDYKPVKCGESEKNDICVQVKNGDMLHQVSMVSLPSSMLTPDICIPLREYWKRKGGSQVKSPSDGSSCGKETSPSGPLCSQVTPVSEPSCGQVTSPNGSSCGQITSPDGSSWGQVNCPFCGKLFTSIFQLLRHQKVTWECAPLRKRMSREDWPFKCELCETRFKNLYELKAHTLSKHTDHKDMYIQNIGNILKQHEQIYSHSSKANTSSEVQGHLQSHGDVERNIDMTNKDLNLSLTDKDDVDMKPHACLPCHECFLTQSEFDAHMKMHTIEPSLDSVSAEEQNSMDCEIDSKPFPCLLCNQCYSTSADLETHLKVHSDSKAMEDFDDHHPVNSDHNCMGDADFKPHPCLACNKCFASNSYLEIHMKTHIQVNI